MQKHDARNGNHNCSPQFMIGFPQHRLEGIPKAHGLNAAPVFHSGHVLCANQLRTPGMQEKTELALTYTDTGPA